MSDGGMSDGGVKMRSPARTAGVHRLLGWLARAGAWAEPSQNFPNTVEVYCQVAAETKRLGKAGTADLEHAALARFIARATNADRWTLTVAGREYVRRLRCTDAAMASVKAERQQASACKPQINVCESPLAWLRQRRDRDGRPMISESEFDAGERLRADFWFAQMTPRVTSNWSAPAQGQHTRRTAPAGELQDHVLAARERVHRALTAVGPELSGVLRDVCCHLSGLEHVERAAGWPQRSGKVILRIALSQLARHYGLCANDGADKRPAARMRHWGSQGYRPSLDSGD